MKELTYVQARLLRRISAKLDPDITPKPPTQGDYLEDVPFLLMLVSGAYRESEQAKRKRGRE